MKFQKFEISFLIFGSILVVLFNVILVALKFLVVFEIFKETSNKFTVKFQMITTVSSGSRCDEEEECRYFSWVDTTYNGPHGSTVHKRCFLNVVQHIMERLLLPLLQNSI